MVAEHDGHARYRLLEPVRQYADQRLSDGERETARRRHALYYVAFAEARSHDTNIGGPRCMPATAELDREYPNLRAAFAWAVENQETQLGLRLAGSLNFFWQIYGSTSEGLAWLEHLLALPDAGEPTAARASALLTNAWLIMMAGDYKAAQGYCREALALARRLREPLLEWLALQFSGVTEWDQAAAENYLREAATCARAAGEAAAEASSLGCLAMIACDQGDYTVAQPLAQEAMRLARASGDPWTQAWALLWLGSAALGRGALDDARTALEAGLSTARDHGQPASLTVWILNGLAELDIASGRLQRARDWLVASIRLQNEGGQRWQMTQTLERLVALAAARGQAERAFRLAGASDALYERLSAERPVREREKIEHWLHSAREVLGSEAADAAWAHGQALELEGAIALALASDDTGAPQPRAPGAAGVATGLTAREQEVAVLLAHGMTNRQIAERLVVTERTVAAHVEHLLNKLGFASRHQVGAWATDHGLLS